MQEQGFAGGSGQFQMLLKDPQLGIGRGEIAVKVQAGFTHRHHLVRCGQFGRTGQILVRDISRNMGVKAHGATEKVWIFKGQGAGCLAAGQIGSGEHDMAQTSLPRISQHLGVVMLEGFMGEIGADIDQLHGYSLLRNLPGQWSGAV